MKCVKCKKAAEIKVQNLTTCKSCFLKIIEKRVRKELRNNIRKGDRILTIDDGSADAAVTQFLLNKILKDFPVTIVNKKTTYKLGKEIIGKYNKIIIPWNADKEDEYFLHCIFENQIPQYLGYYKINNKLYIKLLIPVLEKEIKLFAELQGLDYKPELHKSMISDKLDKLEQDYPEIKFSLLKSIKDIKKNI